MVEALTALVIVGFTCGTVLIVINNSLDSMSDQESRLRAIDVARENIESLLAQTSLKEFSETGLSDLYPDIEWSRGIEVVEFQGTSDLWMKAFSTANFYNTDNELEEIEFINWLAPLTDQQQKQVLQDRQKEDEYLEEMQQEELLEEEAADQEYDGEDMEDALDMLNGIDTGSTEEQQPDELQEVER